jgi:hypothetical protein
MTGSPGLMDNTGWDGGWHLLGVSFILGTPTRGTNMIYIVIISKTGEKSMCMLTDEVV